MLSFCFFKWLPVLKCLLKFVRFLTTSKQTLYLRSIATGHPRVLSSRRRISLGGHGVPARKTLVSTSYDLTTIYAYLRCFLAPTLESFAGRRYSLLCLIETHIWDATEFFRCRRVCKVDIYLSITPPHSAGYKIRTGYNELCSLLRIYPFPVNESLVTNQGRVLKPELFIVIVSLCSTKHTLRLLTVDVLAILYNASLLLSDGKLPFPLLCAALSDEETNLIPDVEGLIARQLTWLLIYILQQNMSSEYRRRGCNTLRWESR